MKNIANLNELLEVENNVKCRRKSPVLGIVIALVGIAAVVYSYLIKDIADRSTLFFTVGFIVTVVGICLALRKRYDLIYTPTGEKISCEKLLFEYKERARLQSCVEQGDIDRMKEFCTSQSSPLRAVAYTTPSRSWQMAQIQEYVPHQYEPAMEPIVFRK